MCHMFAAQDTRYLFQHSFMELLLYASPAPDSGEHSENRLKAGRQMGKIDRSPGPGELREHLTARPQSELVIAP